ncbi:MAG TPA: response regulator [Abditibacteriaceae bacterium]|jgi:CheY-like chemotaxis protein
MANVLLVDDNGNILLTLAIALRRLGHKVTVSPDPCQALTLLKRQRFDFLVSDVRMPRMSGIELAAEAKRQKHVPRIILTSAYSNVEAREGVAEAYLRKPIDVQQLHELLSDTQPDSSVEMNIDPSTPDPGMHAPRRTRNSAPPAFPGDTLRAFAT